MRRYCGNNGLILAPCILSSHFAAVFSVTNCRNLLCLCLSDSRIHATNGRPSFREPYEHGTLQMRGFGGGAVLPDRFRPFGYDDNR